MSNIMTTAHIKRKHPEALCEVPLTNGGSTIVDCEEYARVIQYKWYRFDTKRTSYARQTSHKYGKLFLHQFLLGFDQELDHIDGNGLNNQKSNLRKLTHQQNTFGQRKRLGEHTSIYKGVYWGGGKKKPWRAQICINGKSKYLGSFETEWEAAEVYDNYAQEIFGEFARKNL